ncbi:hypothetical protein MYX82_00850 [Acidobacteria bacterium AH-259-D05]|nr:hypothetical protein [Acidobacteria bacterium AH-259-D05]
MYFIENVQIGKKIEHKVTITDNLHNQFAQFSGDSSPIHCDEEFCLKTKFRKKLGYAFLITTLLSKIYGTIFPGGSELCLKQICNFENPFYIDDILNFELEVTHKNESAKMITVITKVKNQDGVLIFKGEAILQLTLGIP